MKLLIAKKSGKKFPPPYNGDGLTAIAVGVAVNELDPKKRQAYILENGKVVNCEMCNVIEDLESLDFLRKKEKLKALVHFSNIII